VVAVSFNNHATEHWVVDRTGRKQIKEGRQ